MSTISITEIQRDLLGCLRRVEHGETLVIVRGGAPFAELRPVRAKEARAFGLCAGQVTISDDFDAPLPDDLLEDFNGL